MSKTHSGQDYVKAAQRAGLKVRHGKGDHVVIDGPETVPIRPMTVPLHKELATGTDHAIRSWFKAVGILVVIVAIAIIAL